MARISSKRRRFPAAVIQHAVGLYVRFTLSLRDVEEMMADRGVDVSYQTIRAWALKFGPKTAANLRRRRLPPSPRGRLDELVSSIGGEHVCIWRAVDDEVMDLIVQKRRDAGATLRFLRRLLKNHNVAPEIILTDGLRSYRAALDRRGLADRHRPGRLRKNSRAENSHLSIRTREGKMQGFRSRAFAQRFLETHAAVYNTLNVQRRLVSRGAMRVLRTRPESVWSRAVA
jgi:putative transposase